MRLVLASAAIIVAIGVSPSLAAKKIGKQISGMTCYHSGESVFITPREMGPRFARGLRVGQKVQVYLSGLGLVRCLVR